MFEDAEEFTFAEKIDLSRKVMPLRKLRLLPDEGKNTLPGRRRTTVSPID